jgi:hypothetical protein
MKLQLQHRSIRVRLDRAEFTALIEGHPLRLDLRHGADALLAVEVVAGRVAALTRDGHDWRLELPLADLEAWAPTLPRRDGLHFGLDGGLVIDLEVDVRP